MTIKACRAHRVQAGRLPSFTYQLVTHGERCLEFMNTGTIGSPFRI